MKKNSEYISRLNKKSFLPYDALCVIPLITFQSKPNPYFVLIAQYRPPINLFVLDLVAGLAEDKNPLLDIERELNEETGYTCEKDIIHESPIIAGDGDLYEITNKTCTIKINGDKEENIHRKQNLEDEENIIVIHVEIKKDILKDVISLCKENNYGLTDIFWFMVIGLDS